MVTAGSFHLFCSSATMSPIRAELTPKPLSSFQEPLLASPGTPQVIMAWPGRRLDVRSGIIGPKSRPRNRRRKKDRRRQTIQRAQMSSAATTRHLLMLERHRADNYKWFRAVNDTLRIARESSDGT